jgi:heavy metal translocating P-type ATPase
MSTPVAAATCDLCGLPVGHSPLEQSLQGEAHVFCCAGCLNVYSILLESGVVAAGEDFRQSALYQQSLKLGLISNPGGAPPLIPDGAENREALYQLSGMWCSACGWLIEHAVSREYGVISAEVLFTSDLLRVRYCPQFIEPGRIPRRVSSLGYQASEFSAGRETRSADHTSLMLRLGIAGALWMNVMLFSLVIYASYFEGIAPWARAAIPFVLLALASPVVFYSAWPIHRIALFGLRCASVRMEALISIGVLAAFSYSAIQAFLGGPHLYFDTACAIVTLVLAGKALEMNAKDKTAQAAMLLYRLLPSKARIVQDGRERYVSIEALQPGFQLLVKPGERIPADAVIIEGVSSVDESVVTGESALIPRCVGDPVIAGSLNAAGVLSLRVTRAAADSTLSQILRSVENALATRSPLERAVDRVSRLFVPAVTLIALATLAGWILAGLPAGEAMLRAIAVLVIACPCALGLATPLATTTTVGAASRRGILIRDASVLETLHRIDVVVLDKTGTVTEGDFRVQEASLSPSLLARLAGLERNSEHPLAHALLRYASEAGISPIPVSNVVVHPGLGIEAESDGTAILAGSCRFLQSRGIAPGAELLAETAAWKDAGLTTVFASCGGETGAIALGDRIRPGAVELVQSLKCSGIRTVLLSGDSATTTARIAACLQVDECQAEVLPDEKANVVRSLRKPGVTVAMIGDGINDAPALAAADLGIAMGSATDLAMQAAPVVLVSNSLSRIADTFRIASFTLRVIRQNLFWAFIYNLAAISLAVLGALNPILAAAAMVLSSFSVIANTLRLRRA